MKFIKTILLVLAFSLLANGAWAAKYAPLALTPQQQQSIKKINAYFNGFQTLKSEFVQISPKGRSTQGVLLISKPGKLRFDYAPPNPLLIISDGRWLTIKDRVKERGDQFPLSATPLRLVVAPKLDLLAEANVIAFESAGGVTSVSLVDRKDKLGGYIVLVFDENANQLQQWVIVDGKGRQTTVQLSNIEFGGKFDPKLFIGVINRPDSKN
jgi:outer membrane lipoprotein-sorting protein